MKLCIDTEIVLSAMTTEEISSFIELSRVEIDRRTELSMNCEEWDLVQSGQKIKAIAQFRKRTGENLVVSKDVADRFEWLAK